MKRMIVLFAAITTLGIAAAATTTTASADVHDEHWFAHGAAIAASNYARKQLDVDIPWYDWNTSCELVTKRRAKCSTGTAGGHCAGPQCRRAKEAQCSGTLKVRLGGKFHYGAVDAYKRRISCDG